MQTAVYTLEAALQLTLVHSHLERRALAVAHDSAPSLLQLRNAVYSVQSVIAVTSYDSADTAYTQQH
jgi:hypothetical protein